LTLMVTALAMCKTLDVWNRAPAHQGAHSPRNLTSIRPKSRISGPN
jgi:hypothetical protein